MGLMPSLRCPSSCIPC